MAANYSMPAIESSRRLPAEVFLGETELDSAADVHQTPG